MTKSFITPTPHGLHFDPALALLLLKGKLICDFRAYWTELPGALERDSETSATIRIPLALLGAAGINEPLDRLNPALLDNCLSMVRTDSYLDVTSIDCALGDAGRLWINWRSDPLLQAMLSSLMVELALY